MDTLMFIFVDGDTVYVGLCFDKFVFCSLVCWLVGCCLMLFGVDGVIGLTILLGDVSGSKGWTYREFPAIYI